MNKVVTIIQKEWAEVFKNRMVVFTIIFMPLMFAAIPLIILYTMRGTAMADVSGEMPAQFLQFCAQGLSAGECFQVYMVNQFLIMFMITPMIIPVNIAAYSIVGEKTTRSLEPLLASPITTVELLAGKNLAAVIPAVAATMAGFAIFAAGAAVIVENRQVLLALLDPMWLLAVLGAGPLLAVLSVNFSLMVSSRVNDPRVAEQLSAVVIVPLLLLFFGQIAGLFFLNTLLIVLITVGLLLVDAGMVYLAVRLFQRETILTRWK
ncbi:MAG: ABC transporter permease subunit [Chloroflexota bacterium]